MDIGKSEARSPVERMILEDLSTNGDISVTQEPGRTPSSPPFIKTEVLHLHDDDDDDDDDDDEDDNDVNDSDRDRDHVGEDTTSQTLLVTDFLAVDYSADPQHSAMKQPDIPNTVMHHASVHPFLAPVEIKSELSIAQEPECYEPIQINSDSKPSQANTESNSVQELQCLGPFIELSTIKCPKCSVILTEYYQIRNHSCIAEHIRRKKKKQKYKCCFCEKEYGNVYNLRKHIKTYFKKKYVKCSVCGVRLSSISSFKGHALMHTNQWPYYCDICGQGSASEHHLELHKTIHTNEKSWMCDVCGAMFLNQARLNSHKIVHSERKYECDLCYAKFRERYHVKEHKKKVHSVRKKMFQCEECSSAFTSKFVLQVHKEMKHNDNSTGETFICSVCNKEFKHGYPFKRHMYKHKCKNENVLYTCDICKRSFGTKCSLIRHISAHYGKQFSCNLCGMLFTQQGSVKRHMLKLHTSDT